MVLQDLLGKEDSWGHLGLLVMMDVQVSLGQKVCVPSGGRLRLLCPTKNNLVSIDFKPSSSEENDFSTGVGMHLFFC